MGFVICFHSLFICHRIVFKLEYQLFHLQLDKSKDANDLSIILVCLFYIYNSDIWEAVQSAWRENKL